MLYNFIYFQKRLNIADAPMMAFGAMAAPAAKVGICFRHALKELAFKKKVPLNKFSSSC